MANIIGHVSDGVKEPVLSRVFEYWRNVDADLGKKVEEGVRAGRRLVSRVLHQTLWSALDARRW